MKLISNILFVAGFLSSIWCSAQNTTTIGSEDLNPKAVLTLVTPNGNQGFILPVVEDKDNINPTSSEKGMLVYENSTSEVFLWDGAKWINIVNGGNGATLWSENGNDLFFDSGNVGIGTTTPTNALHIRADSHFPLRVESVSGPDSGIEFANEFGLQGYMGNIGLGSDMAIGTVEGNDTGSLLFLTNNLVRMNLTPAGRLGIGTLGPNSKLDVFASPAESDLGEGISLYAIRNGKDDFSGIESRISGHPSNSGDLIGFSTKMAGPGNKTGLDVDITNESDDDTFGVKLSMFNTGSNPSYGLFNIFTGTGTGTRYGIYSFNDDHNYLSGNLGIGIPEPNAKLDVIGDAKILENVHIGTGILSSEVMLEVVAQDDNLINEGINVRSVRNGNIGYTGMTSDVLGNGSGFKSGYRTTLSGNGSKTGLAITISGSGDSNYGVFSNGEDRNYFSGNVGIGTSVPTEKLDVNGSIKGNSILLDDWEIKQDGLNVLSLSYGGTLKGVFLSTTGQYNMTSDRRLKKEIRPLEAVLTKVIKLEASRYQYRANNPEKMESIGFIAQDVQQLFPELVHSATNENQQDLLTLDYSGFGVLAIKAIQEQQAVIKEQHEVIQSQEQRLKKLEAQVEKLLQASSLSKNR